MSRPSAPLALSLSALTAATLVVAGCGKMKAPWTPRTGAVEGAAADTAAVDTAPGARDTAVGGARAPGDTGGADRGAPVEERPAPADSATADSILTDSVSADSAAVDSAGGGRLSLEELRERGPTYTRYGVSPQLLPGDWLSDLLSDTLAPVVDRHDDLSVEEFALFWVLVDREGEVRDVVLHTTSRSEPFDQAARAVAEHLQYRPALSDGEPVPVWVLARISLLMR